MAYEKQTWKCGETITADKLNHMEDGIANSGGGTLEPLILRESSADTLDTTFGEIKEAFNSGRPIFFANRVESPVGNGTQYAPMYELGTLDEGGGYIASDITGAVVMYNASADTDFPSASN